MELDGVMLTRLGDKLKERLVEVGGDSESTVADINNLRRNKPWMVKSYERLVLWMDNGVYTLDIRNEDRLPSPSAIILRSGRVIVNNKVSLKHNTNYKTPKVPYKAFRGTGGYSGGKKCTDNYKRERF